MVKYVRLKLKFSSWNSEVEILKLKVVKIDSLHMSGEPATAHSHGCVRWCVALAGKEKTAIFDVRIPTN